eukprot:CAMPEP_0170246836 /NCGR_PEP_ID=MMETSP0116_2-20130129/23206_1 /TAXON_ID=400756 /ORGANISM="Durinskia baltica, Strain CSIRO CS-38" /LENGTH=98 /DNA_ID=CAMNT_0010497715 /DNA_START=186 /DNA_END=482 /DNA_ORIENTATION=+
MVRQQVSSLRRWLWACRNDTFARFGCRPLRRLGRQDHLSFRLSPVFWAAWFARNSNLLTLITMQDASRNRKITRRNWMSTNGMPSTTPAKAPAESKYI